jgi:hypothetical protein
MLGVDACNTVLGVLIFAAAMNLGQSWATVLTLFGCTFHDELSIAELVRDENDADSH